MLNLCCSVAPKGYPVIMWCTFPQPTLSTYTLTTSGDSGISASFSMDSFSCNYVGDVRQHVTLTIFLLFFLIQNKHFKTFLESPRIERLCVGAFWVSRVCIPSSINSVATQKPNKACFVWTNITRNTEKLLSKVRVRRDGGGGLCRDARY